MTTIGITPAGNQLYEVELRDETGASRHEVGVPDALLERMDLEAVAMQEVVRAAMEFLVERLGREPLDRDIDLGAMADRYPELVEQVPAHARERATSQTPPPDLREADSDAPTQGQRLIDEVEQEQQAGQASRGDRRH